MTLDELPQGRAGVVERVEGGRSALRMRLMEMGFTPGTRVSAVKSEQSSELLEIELRGYTLLLRRYDARQIIICGGCDGSCACRKPEQR